MVDKIDLRKFIISEVKREKIKMKNKQKKLSSFKDDFTASPESWKEVAWKKNKKVYINEYGIKHLLLSLKTLTKSETKGVSGEVKMNDYNKKDQTIKYNGVKVPIYILEQLERMWVYNFGQYAKY